MFEEIDEPKDFFKSINTAIIFGSMFLSFKKFSSSII